MERFQQECMFLENIRHPNIVQYLGMTRDPESRLPVLLMELLDESLTKMLEQSQCSLAYYVQVDICHDIALAVAYLHSNDIIHRDLSSNNVLIMAKSRAKVTDFGMSKLAGAAPSMTPLTMCPGTLAYMPPEALHEPPVYTKQLDCFSEGVIMIQVCTRLWPEPGPRMEAVQDSRSPTGTTQMPVLEPERRKNHIDMIDPGHGLLPIAMDCLHYQENERPSSEELCQRLAGLKETREYRESIEQVERVQNDIAQLERQMEEIQLRAAATVQQKCNENQQLQGEVESKDLQIQLQERQMQSKDEKLTQKVQEIQQLNQQLKEQEQVTAEIQRTNSSLLQQVDELQQQLSQQKQQLEEQEQVTADIQGMNNSLQQRVEQFQIQLSKQHHQKSNPPKLPSRGPQVQVQQDHAAKPPPSMAKQHLPLQKPQLPRRQLQTQREWISRGRAPNSMVRGAAVVDGNMVYFMSWDGQTCCYNLSTQTWSQLLMCPCVFSSLAIIRGFLTAIGGRRGSAVLNELLALRVNLVTTWLENFSPMPTKRSHTVAVTTLQHLIVAGGENTSNLLDLVEVMDIETLMWSTAASLPHPYSYASATICGDQLYMLGEHKKVVDSRKRHTNLVVLTCSLTKLVQSYSESSSNSVWHRIADVPVYRSTCAAINGELVAVGGLDVKGKTTSAIHKYDPTTDSWDIISNMPTARYRCLVAVLPTSEMMVVGGMINMHDYDPLIIDKVESYFFN